MNRCQEILSEYMDIQDRDTRDYILSIVSEEQQSSSLLNLSNKLYSIVINKVADIDYGGIPDSKGDVSKIKDIEKTMMSLDVVEKLLKKYKQSTEPVDMIKDCFKYLVKDKDLYKKGFMFEIDIIKNMYINTALAIISSTSFLISSIVDFVYDHKTNSFSMQLHKSGVARTKDNVIYHSIENYNTAYRKGQIKKAFDPLIKSKSKNFALLVGGFAVGAAIAVTIIPILRQMVYYFFFARVKVSEYFEIQALILEANARDLESTGDKENIKSAKEQREYAETFRKISNKISLDDSDANVKSKSEMKESKKMKRDEVEEGLPDKSDYPSDTSDDDSDSLF